MKIKIIYVILSVIFFAGLTTCRKTTDLKAEKISLNKDTLQTKEQVK